MKYIVLSGVIIILCFSYLLPREQKAEQIFADKEFISNWARVQDFHKCCINWLNVYLKQKVIV
jgi:hypothetical protein